MNILLEPNIAYLLLVTGVLLGMMAMVTPGTGVLEVSSLFALALAGYAVYVLSINLWALILLLLCIVPFIYALRRANRQLYLILSILGLVAGSVFLFRDPDGSMSVHPALASVVSLLASGFMWLVIGKTIQASATIPTHDLGQLVGMLGEAKTRIHAEGSAQVDGELWSVRSDRPIRAGSRIRVVNREGFILEVEEDHGSTEAGS